MKYDIGNDQQVIMNITINDIKIERISFISLDFMEEIHNVLPTCTLEVRAGTEDLKKFMEHGAEILITLSSSNNIYREIKFAIEKTTIKELPKYAYQVNIDGIIQSPGYYIGDYKQESFINMSSSDVFDSLENVKTDVRIDTTDEQTWIRYNTTEKQFVDYLYNFSYKKDDLVLLALTTKGELIVTSFNEIRNNDAIRYSTYKDDSDITINKFSQIVNFDLFSYKFSPTRENIIFKVPVGIITREQISKESLFTEKEYDNILPYHPFQMLEDNMNTFEEYIIARRFNQVKRHNLHNYEIEMVLTTHNDFSSIELLQLIELYEKDEKSGHNTIIAEGEYIISKIHYSFHGDNVPIVKVNAIRDFFIKG